MAWCCMLHDGPLLMCGVYIPQVVPGPVTLLPPLITVLVAVTTRNVLLSLFTGEAARCCGDGEY